MIRNVIVLVFFALVIVLASCKDDPQPAPQAPNATISLRDSTGSYAVLSTLGVKLEAFAPRGIKSATCKIWQGAEEIETLYQIDSTQISLTADVGFYLATAYAGQTLTVTFTIEDGLMNIIGDTVSFQVARSEIAYITSDTLATYGNATYGSFYNIVSPASYYGVQLSKTTTKKQVDFVYYYTKTDGAILTNPASEGAETTWATQSGGLWPLAGVENDTKLYDLSSNIDYASISTAAELENALVDQIAVSELKGLMTGQLIGFQLVEARGAKAGLIKIKEVKGNTTANSEIIFEGKVAK